jgi:hypothetical protein
MEVIAFQTLIGTVKSYDIADAWSRELSFQTLIGTVKSWGYRHHPQGRHPSFKPL